MTLEPLVTVSWIWAIWQGVSSFVLQARVFRLMSLGCSVAYLWAPAIMASQKPPVALVIRVTLMGPVAAGPVMLVGAELEPTAVVEVGAAAGGAVVVLVAPLLEPLLQPATSIVAAPSPASAFKRDDTCVAPSIGIPPAPGLG